MNPIPKAFFFTPSAYCDNRHFLLARYFDYFSIFWNKSLVQ